MRKRFWKALRPIELIIISLVVGVTLAIFIWRYDHFKVRAIESEAKFFLQEIYAAQIHYRSQHERFATLDELFALGLAAKKNYYSLSEGSPPSEKGFLILALGLKDTKVFGQSWSVDHKKAIKKLGER